MSRRVAATLVVCAIAGPARAEEARRVDLSVRHLPMLLPTSLAMRWRGAPAPARAEAAAPAAPVAPTAALRERPAELAAPAGRLDQKVIFRFNLGFGIDGGQPSGAELLSGATLDEETTYARLRSYGFGDLVLGTRGLVFETLGTYLATQFRFDQDVDRATGAVPSVYHDDEIQNLLVRSAYAESQGFFQRSWLRPLYVRAGRQYKYGVAVAHFDGLSLGYDTRPVSASLWFGSRVSLFGFGQTLAGPQAEFAGVSARVDLYELSRIPLVLTGETLDLGGTGHAEYGLAFRWKPDILVRASLRQFESRSARQTLAVWARLSEVTTVTAEVDNRTADDWIYDLFVLRAPEGSGDPRRYLNLGPPLPRLQLDVRAGTVILRNLDVLLRGAAAIEHAEGGQDAAFSPTYIEAGAAVEVRLRRYLRLGSTFTARRYRRDVPPQVDDSQAADPLPDPALVGERSFYEGGVGVDYSVGARRFNASGELYGRRYQPVSPYVSPVADTADFRSGGRFSVEGWAANRLRIKAEYDVSLADIDVAPELRGLKSLRILVEGSF